MIVSRHHLSGSRLPLRAVPGLLLALLVAGCGAPPTPELALADLRTVHPTATLVSAVPTTSDWQNTSVRILFRLPPDSTTLEVDYGYRLVNHVWTLVDRDSTPQPATRTR